MVGITSIGAYIPIYRLNQDDRVRRGFSRRGMAKEDREAGTFTLGGELSVNADGGLNCFGHPLGASGLRL